MRCNPIGRTGYWIESGYADPATRLDPAGLHLVINILNVLRAVSPAGARTASILDEYHSSQEKNIVLNFDITADRNAEAEKVRNLQKVTVKEVKKLDPCIMICNVAQMESKDELLKNLVDRNIYLQSITNIGNKIKHVFDKPAAGGTRHYVLRCDPQIRKLIIENHDNVKLAWGSYSVRDRYITTTCFYCQKYGHIEAKCPKKEKNESPICGRCAGDHRSKDCKRDQNIKKCANCIEQNKHDVNHFVNEKCCESLLPEIKKGNGKKRSWKVLIMSYL